MSKPPATHIYMLGYSDGIVKVGRTSDPKRRFNTLQAEGRRRGAEIEHRWLRVHDDPRRAEWYLRFIGFTFSKRAWGTEYFRSDFPGFVRLIEVKFEQYGLDLGNPIELARAT